MVVWLENHGSHQTNLPKTHYTSVTTFPALKPDMTFQLLSCALTRRQHPIMGHDDDVDDDNVVGGDADYVAEDD